MSELRKTIQTICKKNVLVILMIIFTCPILVVSYASFIFNTDEYKASEMYIGNLLYSIKIDNNPVNILEVVPGYTEAIVEVSSLNSIASNYKLVYTPNPNITIVYAEDENTPSYGLVTTTKTSTLLIRNTSEENITITFDIIGGYKTNEVAEIEVPDNYTEIATDYTKFDYNTIVMYVDGVQASELNPVRKYNLISYSCTNGEEVEWNQLTNDLTIKSMTNQTKCQLYFEEIPPWYELCTAQSTDLRCKLIKAETAYADNTNSTYVNNAIPGIDFSKISSDTNGRGLYYTTDTSKTENSERVYYYRGDIDNNHLVFGGYCWRIVRTVEDGSVRLRYNGVATQNGDTYTCAQKGANVGIASSIPYNRTYGDNAYVGYMMGIDNECAINSSSCAGAINTTSKEQAQTNTYSSHIKQTIDAWYSGGSTVKDDFTGLTNKLIDYSSLIADTPYCNDRSIDERETTYTSAFGTNRTHYASNTRIYVNKEPTYKCAQKNDQFTLKVASGGAEGYGNNALDYPIGLLTADEIAYAGGGFGSNNYSYYLYTGGSYWTMSPYFFAVDYTAEFYVGGGGNLDFDGLVCYYDGVFASVSLKSSTTVSSGTGAYNDPYVVE